MATKTETIVTLTDDLDGSKAERTVVFAADGVNYEIELSKKNVTAFEKTVAPYIAAGRKVSRSRQRVAAPASTTRRAKTSRTDLAEIRQWAKANGHNVSERGQIAQSVQDAYDAAM